MVVFNGRAVVATVCVIFASASLVHAQTTAPKVSGYVKAAFGGDMKTSSETSVTNARVKVSGAVNDKTSYTVFIDAVRDDVLLDAYVLHALTDAFSVRAGQFKTAYSTDNLISGSKIPFINRPYIKSSVSPAYRDRGVEMSYVSSRLGATVGMMNGSGQNRAEDNTNKGLAIRVVGTVSPVLALSGNYYTGRAGAAAKTTEYTNAGVNGAWGAFEYMGEYAMKKNAGMTGNAFFVWVNRDFATGGTAVPVVTAAARVERADPDTDMDDDARTRYTLGMTAHLGKKYTDRVMVNYEIRDAETGEADDYVGVEYQIMF